LFDEAALSARHQAFFGDERYSAKYFVGNKTLLPNASPLRKSTCLVVESRRWKEEPMATKEEIIAGLELTVSQAKRTTALWAEGEWDWKRATGWTPKEVYAHLAAVAGVIPQLGQGLSAAPENADIAQGMDINAMNAQAVGGMASMTFPQVMETFESNYEKLIDYVKSVPDDTLNQKRRFFSEPIPVSDILANTVVLHGLHHVYEANSRFESPV
jgi:DinB superfamily